MGYTKIIIWFILVAVIAWFLFVQPTTKREETPGKTLIQFPTWGGVPERKAWAEMEKDFESKNPDIDLKIELIPIKYEEKLLAMLAAKTAPDLMTLPIADFAPKNVFLPIEDFFDNDTTIDKADFLPGLMNVGVWKGKRYGINNAISTQLLFFRKDHFIEAGLPTPNEYAARGEWNWKTFREVCKKLTIRNKDGKIIRYGFQYYYPIWTYIYMFGGEPFKNEFTEINFTDPRVYNALQAVADLALVDSVAPPIEMESQMGAGWQAFLNNKNSMFISGPYLIKRLAKLDSLHNARIPDPSKHLRLQDIYDVAPPPLEPGGRSMDITGNTAAGIWVGSKHPEEAYRWVSYLASSNARLIWARLGFNLPGLKTLVDNPAAWIDTTIVPDHFHLFFDLAEDVLKDPPAIYPIIPRKLNNLMMGHVWEQIRSGRKSAKKALEDFAPEANKIMQRGF